MGEGEIDFTDFYEASWAPCFRAVVATVGNAHLAEELVAEAFAKAWASWRKVSRHPAARAWVVRTALNTGVGWWRRHGRELPLADVEIAVSMDTGDGLDATLLRALRRLPARQREVIALRIFLDLDTATTARQMGIAPGTVKAHLFNAAATLRSELASLEDTPCTT